MSFGRDSFGGGHGAVHATVVPAGHRDERRPIAPQEVSGAVLEY